MRRIIRGRKRETKGKEEEKECKGRGREGKDYF